MTYNVFSGTLNPTHSLTHSRFHTVGQQPVICAVFLWDGAAYYALSFEQEHRDLHAYYISITAK